MEPPTTTERAEGRSLSREHIEITPGTCGGKPRIAGTRIRVQDIYVWHELQGQTVDQIISQFPQLQHGDVYAALAYYWDHRDELDREMKEEMLAYENLR